MFHAGVKSAQRVEDHRHIDRFLRQELPATGVKSP